MGSSDYQRCLLDHTVCCIGRTRATRCEVCVSTVLNA